MVVVEAQVQKNLNAQRDVMWMSVTRCLVAFHVDVHVDEPLLLITECSFRVFREIYGCSDHQAAFKRPNIGCKHL